MNNNTDSKESQDCTCESVMITYREFKNIEIPL